MPFEKGQSGNPGGRERASTKLIADTLRRAVLAGAESLRKGAERVVENAADGDIVAWTYLRDTLDGKPSQAVTLAGDQDQPILTKAIVELVRPRDQDPAPGSS